MWLMTVQEKHHHRGRYPYFEERAVRVLDLRGRTPSFATLISGPSWRGTHQLALDALAHARGLMLASGRACPPRMPKWL
jgi:hypothetical protein